MGGGATAATLVEQNDSIAVGIEEAAMGGLAAGPRTTVQKHRRDTVRPPALFDVEAMPIADREFVGREGGDRGIEVAIALIHDRQHRRRDGRLQSVPRGEAF